MAENKNSIYVMVNLNDYYYPEEIEKRTLCFNMDINCVLNDIAQIKKDMLKI